MDAGQINLRTIAQSLLLHTLLFGMLVVGMFWKSQAEPLSVVGPVIEATLVDYAAAALPKPVKTAKPQPPRPTPIVPPAPKPEPPRVKAPEAPPLRAEDQRDQEKVRLAADAVEKAEREQELLRRKEQLDLTEPESELEKMERERQQQLADIRKLREAAEDKRRIEERKLAQLQTHNQQADIDRQRAAEQAQAAPVAGNEGKDDSLLGHYKVAMRNQITPHWLRPDNVSSVRCTVRLIQIIGGEVLSATVLPPCSADDATKRSMEAAVLRAQPLPYRGFEAVFQRQIDFNFCYPESLCSMQ
ncbi:MAG: cell envelope integrity protein TolA [Lysobacterales bacterium]